MILWISKFTTVHVCLLSKSRETKSHLMISKRMGMSKKKKKRERLREKEGEGKKRIENFVV